tara:strand:+ start:1011 stop:1637 length:627 start_codon:yes stop_codon:yes gene_type:complete
MEKQNIVSKKEGSGLGIAGFILAIISLFLGSIGLITGIIALIFCIIQLKRKKTGLAIAGLIISIIAIILGIVSLVFFILSIEKFKGIEKSANVAIFYSELQSEINKAWQSQNSEFDFEIDLPSEINKICFVDFSSEITIQSYYNQIQNYKNSGANFVLIPPEKTDMPQTTLQHIDIGKITKIKNPYCKSASGNIKIKKAFTDALVTIE